MRSLKIRNMLHILLIALILFHGCKILSRVCGGDYIRQGIGLTTGFMGSHTVTHNYSVYTL
jgi:hypothetical protein